ncbi:U2 small nuclear ribonucleoprotein auxiliary factor 35 kDa subunit-related protein 2 [Nematolebias whitei]|uniref:U2 small nuclear ribonucleoprotein auxiliary factor 35 kDa subunit-related protein 2 n=1 Tax=Nematolebias whitei TaxID=451745 RepID=UPI00189B200A|nr:U2 small nuclear ribonucleoprotein auxiliary factor 35 kDa subunit-related protein 2 [Nematolebias whitei]
MAASTPLVSAPVLSQKQRRAALRKERRRRKRRALAQARESDLNNEVGEEEDASDEDAENNDATEEDRLREHEEWLERERLAQEEFRLRTEREEAARKKKEEEERLIKDEWESQQRREREEKEQRQQEKRGREEAVQKMLDEAESQLEKRGPWMNPEAPAASNSENFGTERDVANCPFFLKTGACRFGDRCSRKHIYPTSSPTLLIRGMFVTFGMEESRRDDYDMDACLEHSEEDLHESFLEFYHDVLPEFKSVGKVVQFKVCCNHEPHLRGNVYIQFATEEQSNEAFVKFNGRWYAGRQLQCEACPVTRWKSAICGLYDRKKCPKGKHCNFLHVFRNPGNEFWEADRDLQLSPVRSVRGSWRDERRSERYSERSWRRRRYSKSPEQRERSRSRRADDERSRSSHRHREDRRTSRSRHGDRRTERRRSRSWSGDREQRRPRNGSRDKYRNRSEEKERSEDEDTDGEARSRSASREKKRKKRSRDKSPEKPEQSKTDETNSQRRHKRSKKTKKSKKKQKKKSRSPNVPTSSGESENERESEEEPVNIPGDSNKQECFSSEVKSEQTETRSDSTENGNIHPC